MSDLIATFKALSDDTRLRLLAILQVGRFNGNELISILDMGQSRISRHLKILAEAGIVEAHRDGSWVYYSLSVAWDTTPLLSALGPALSDRLERERSSIDACLSRRRERADRFFRDVASGWDARRDRELGPPEHLEYLVDLIEREGSQIGTAVDLGTGTGVALGILAGHAEKVIGVDASAEMISVARDKVQQGELQNVELRLGEVEHLPMRDGVADLMVANMILHHVTSPQAALRDVARGLRSDGRLFIADFVAHEREEYRETLGDLWLGFESSELEHWIDEAGFVIDEQRKISGGKERPDVQVIAATRKRSGTNTKSEFAVEEQQT